MNDKQRQKLAKILMDESITEIRSIYTTLLTDGINVKFMDFGTKEAVSGTIRPDGTFVVRAEIVSVHN